MSSFINGNFFSKSKIHQEEYTLLYLLSFIKINKYILSRTTITDMHCDGVAALETGTQSFTLDWLHLFCNLSDSAIKTEVKS